MEIEVDQAPTIFARLDRDKFESVLKETMDIKNAVMASIVMVENKTGFSQDEIFNFIYMSVDWGNFMQVYNYVSGSFMDIKLYRCMVYDMHRYRPEKLDNNRIKFSEKLVTEDNFLVVMTHHAGIGRPLEYMLSQSILDYADVDWGALLGGINEQ